MDRAIPAIPAQRTTIKFLITNSVAGSIIGIGGSAIKELIEVSGAHIKVSSTEEMYPGRNQRIVLISGNIDAVLCAQSLLWILFAQSAQSAEKGSEKRSDSWSPRIANENSLQYSDLEIEGEVTIPAAAAGLIIGKNGSTIDEIRVVSGIQRFNMTNKVEADFTHERILHLRGTVSSCAEAVKLIIFKLAEDPGTNQYVNKGVTYSAGVFSQASDFRGKDKHHNKAVGSFSPVPPSEEEAVTLTINIPEAQIGNILGKNGTILREIVSLSRAKVIISNKGEYAEGTTDRIVTVKGNIGTAHCAATLIQHKLHTPNPRRERKNPGAADL